MDDREIISGLSAEEQERLKKIEKLDSNQKRKKFIFAGVTVVLVALFVFGTFFGGKYILSYEGSEALPVEQPGQVNTDPETFRVQLMKLVADTENYAGIKVDRRNHISVPEESVKVESDGADAATFFAFVRGSIEDKLSEIYEKNNRDGAYGEDFSPYIPDLSPVSGGAGKIEVAGDEEDAFRMTAKISFDGMPFEKIASSPVMKLFDLDDADELRDGAIELFTEAADISDVEISYNEFTVTANITRALEDSVETQKLNSLVFDRSCNVSLTAAFKGELKDFGTQKISFLFKASEEYNFTRVSFDISKDEYFIEKGDSDEINRKITTDESVQDIKVKWSSSDESVLTVDEKGFYKGKSVSDKPVTVTGEYTFNGVTYTDEVLFYVRIPVESIKLSDKELELKVGEESTLTPVIKPENATLKQVYWFSTDESVVTVENGTVKAVSPGEAGVYAITFDGNFKKTCPVTVTQ